MTCNGSRLLAVSTPPATTDADGNPIDTFARDEGTAAHYMATAVYKGDQIIDELIDRKAPNGVYMTAEMAEHIAAYQAVWQTQHSLLGVELNTSYDNSPYWVVDGRADFIALSAETELHVIDFKYGWRIVEPENNWTLISHAIGLLLQQQFTPQTIRFSIFQPRPHHPDGPLRSWVINHSQLTQLYTQLDATLTNPSDALITSPHCHKCPAIATCPAARIAEMNAIEASETAYDDQVSNEMLAFNLDNLHRAKKLLEDRIEAFSEMAKHRINSGAVIANYFNEMGQGNRIWKESVDAQTLQMLTGKDLTAKPKLITPAAAERLGVDKATVKALTERPSTGIKLVRVSANKKAAKIFG